MLHLRPCWALSVEAHVTVCSLSRSKPTGYTRQRHRKLECCAKNVKRGVRASEHARLTRSVAQRLIRPYRAHRQRRISARAPPQLETITEAGVRSSIAWVPFRKAAAPEEKWTGTTPGVS